MLTLSALIRDSSKVKAEARKVHVTSFDPRVDMRRVVLPEGEAWEVEWDTTGSGESYHCIMRFFAGVIYTGAKVWVSCDCDDFRYRLEYVLSQRGSSSILHSSGGPAQKTNPKGQARLCKHLLKIIGIIPQASRHLEVAGLR